MRPRLTRTISTQVEVLAAVADHDHAALGIDVEVTAPAFAARLPVAEPQVAPERHGFVAVDERAQLARPLIRGGRL